MKKLIIFAVIVTIFAAITAVGVSASTTQPELPDMTATMQSSLDGLLTQVFAIIGIVVPVVLAIVGGKIAITKGIQIFKSMTGRG